ncbi:MAG: T9SS type A sorting domain-containing protein [bacterium]|nr:T9SS type A sorting domain-containing protein [bacterium]
MSRILSLILSILLITLIASSVLARPVERDTDRIHKKYGLPGLDTDQSGTGARVDSLFLFAASGPGAFGSDGTDGRGFTFDGAGGAATAGWTSVDKTSQQGMYWHMAPAAITAGHPTDMAGAGQPWTPGDVNNNYLLWCGRQNVCGWNRTIGYGNGWDQWLRIESQDFTDDIVINFYYSTSYEGDVWDHFEVMIEENASGNESIVTHFDDTTEGDQAAHDFTLTIEAADGTIYGDIILRFSTDGAWSDEDGILPSNIGAVWLDNLEVIVDGVTTIQEDFESAIMPSTISADIPSGAGDFAQLYSALFAQDICVVNVTNSWAFYDPETQNDNYPIPVITYGPPYLDNDVRSPILSLAHSLDDPSGQPLEMGADTQVWLYSWVYGDLPENPLIYYSWSIAAQVADVPCVNVAKNDGFVTYADARQWGLIDENVTQYAAESADGGQIEGLQMTLNCVDMFPFWVNINGDGTDHTPGPYFDNARLVLLNASSVAWDVNQISRFQDNFPEVSTGKVRIDSANNIAPISTDFIVPGDSSVIDLNMDLVGGIQHAINPTSGGDLPALYMWFRVVAGPHADMISPDMADQDASDGSWSPWVGTEIFDGSTYGVVQADSARTNGNWSPGVWAFDFNDEYFLPGDVIQLFYRAESVDGVIETSPRWAMSTSPELRGVYTARCLPTDGSVMLFVEDHLGVRGFWDEAFQYNGYGNVDIYSVMGCTSGLDNGLAGRAESVDLVQYTTIVWSSGSIPTYTVSQHGIDNSGDDLLLTNWLENSEHTVALWMMGDMLAGDLGNSSMFLHDVLGAHLISSTQYYDDMTGIMVPEVSAVHPALEYLGGAPTFYVDGGCPGLEDFNVIVPYGTMSSTTFAWEDDSGTGMVAGVLNLDPDGDGEVTNGNGQNNPVAFNPFGYYHAWDSGYALSVDRDYVRLMVGHVLSNLLHAIPNQAEVGIPEDPVPATQLRGNYPNPFNPTTTISFNLAEAGPVELVVYDIAGRRVIELVNAKLDQGSHDIRWDGRDISGNRVASGIYFYKMDAGSYSATDKMVMLK